MATKLQIDQLTGMPSIDDLRNAGVTLTAKQGKALRLARTLAVLTRILQGAIMGYGIVYAIRGDWSALLIAAICAAAINSARPRIPDCIIAAIDDHLNATNEGKA